MRFGRRSIKALTPFFHKIKSNCDNNLGFQIWLGLYHATLTTQAGYSKVDILAQPSKSKMIDFCLMKRRILILIASVIMLTVEEGHAVVTDPIVEVFENISACHELNARNLKPASFLLDTATKDTIKYLGFRESVEACSAAALAWRNVSEPNQRCRSTCWWKQRQPQPQKQKRSQDPLGCYCRVTPLWLPLPDVDVESAVIHWPCTSPGDCSYNGVCSQSTGKCDCDGAWGGVRCGELQLLPVDRATPGFREVNASNGYANVSTWGARESRNMLLLLFYIV